MKSHTLKRLAALLLALAMLFTLASCGKKDETKDDDADPKTEQVSDKNDKNNQDDDAPVATKKPAKEDDDAEPTEKPSKGEETTPSAKAPEVSGSWGTQLDGDEASFRFNDDGSFSAVLAGEDIVGTYTVADGVISLTTSDGDLQELPYCFSNDGALLLLAMAARTRAAIWFSRTGMPPALCAGRTSSAPGKATRTTPSLSSTTPR